MPSQTKTSERLDGWDAIADYLGWHPRTVIRWEKLKGLPIHRVAGGKRQPVYAYREELDSWFQRNRGAISVSQSDVVLEAEEAIPAPVASVRQTRRPSKSAIYLVCGISILIASGLAAAWRLSLPPGIQISGIAQSTADDKPKSDLITDGKKLYFSEKIGEQYFLAAVPVGGGPIERIPVPFPNPFPQDFTSDGKLMLALSQDGSQDERSLWIVPMNGAPPWQVPHVACASAAWSPRGDGITFGHLNAIYFTSSDGSNTRLLKHLEGTPLQLEWSHDGKYLMASVQTLRRGAPSTWRVDFDSSMNAKVATTIEVTGKGPLASGLVLRAGHGYFAVNHDTSTDNILKLSSRLLSRPGVFEASTLTTRFKAIQGLAVDPRTQKLFVLSSGRSNGELIEYDPSNGRFSTFLPGIPATEIDLSKQGDRVAYMRYTDGSLWISKSDGSDGTQISPPGMDTELPRWSPDGRRIAFMGNTSGQPFRIFVSPTNKVDLLEASKGNDDQGAPTWSPDGRFLVHGNVRCQEQESCAIHTIDLVSGKETTLPGSDGLSTARWSPDGQFIAALHSIRHELWVFDIRSKRWRMLAEKVNGNDVSWSSDSSYVYTKSSMTGEAEILRVPVKGGAAQTILNLNSLSKSAGQLDTWFTVTRSNHLIFRRTLDTSEIYEISYKEN